MKLLIITQAIDLDHPILGFFHRWVAEFAVHYEHVHVICLQAGRHSLPANVTVHSLGKEAGKGKLTYLYRFYKLIWQLRHEYNHVFVHMNQVYVILGAPFWRAAGKRIGLWYTHGSVPLSLRIANVLTQHIFTAAAEGFNYQTKKLNVTGHGIDTEHFKPDQKRAKYIDLITVGRIAQSKNLLTLVDVLAEVRKAHDVSLTIVGVAVTEAEKAHEASLRTHIATHNLTDHVHFAGRVAQEDLPQLLNRAKVFVTTAQNGSLDKVMLEAMACGLPIVSLAPGSASLPLGAAQATSKEAFTEQVKIMLQSPTHMNTYADYIVVKHSLQSLVTKIITIYA